MKNQYSLKMAAKCVLTFPSWLVVVRSWFRQA